MRTYIGDNILENLSKQGKADSVNPVGKKLSQTKSEGGLIMDFPKGTRTENNKVFLKFYTMYKSMMQRCYLESNSSYKNYGARGVTVSDEWKNLDFFLETIDSVDGFNLEKILAGELQLDKDIKYKGNKVYSKENCMFVTPSENSGNRVNNISFVAVAPDYSYRVYNNREKFCRENNLDSRHVWNILKKGKGSHKGWQFFYEEYFSEDKIVKRRQFEATSPSGEKFIYEKHSEFAKIYGLSTPNISMVVSGKSSHHKGWKFRELKSM